MSTVNVMWAVTGFIAALLVAGGIFGALMRLETKMLSTVATRFDSLILQVSGMRSDLAADLKSTHRIAVLAATDANGLTRRLDAIEARVAALEAFHPRVESAE